MLEIRLITGKAHKLPILHVHRVHNVVSTIIVALLMNTLPATAQKYQIGVYYFPGWADSTGQREDQPWGKIKPFPDREPLLGWYPEKEVWVAEKHIEWAASYGIDFFAYDWYWDGKKPILNHAIDAYLKAKNESNVKFCLLWANHSSIPESLSQFNLMVEYWITNYFKNPHYFYVRGKPLVIVFSPDQFQKNVLRFGESTERLFTNAREKAIECNLKGIYFVGCTTAMSYWVKTYLPEFGYDAVSGYNYHSRAISGEYTGKESPATNYMQLLDGYKSQWKWILDKSTLPYFIPVTSGWDSRPWGSNSVHDQCSSTPQQFKTMLAEAKIAVDQFPDKTMGTILIYAWNEFGEGGYIEPTQKWQFQYLQILKNVFGK